MEIYYIIKIDRKTIHSYILNKLYDQKLMFHTNIQIYIKYIISILLISEYLLY